MGFALFVSFSGTPITFELQVMPANNFPIDLYMLMDLSASMEDDLANLQRLGVDIGKYFEKTKNQLE